MRYVISRGIELFGFLFVCFGFVVFLNLHFFYFFFLTVKQLDAFRACLLIY